MKIRWTELLTGKQHISRATISTDHPASSYGQPVMLVDGEPWGALECTLNNAFIVEAPKRKKDLALLAQWRRNTFEQLV